MADETCPSVSTILIKEEKGLQIDNGINNCNVTVKEEMSFEAELTSGGLTHVKQEQELLVPDEAGGLTYVKHETFVKQEEELPVSDEDAEDSCHRGEKSCQCPYCNYKCIQSGNLKKHIMACHTGEKPHQCPHCEYKAVDSGKMKLHIMARHTGEFWGFWCIFLSSQSEAALVTWPVAVDLKLMSSST
ncbi:zinc finger protein 219 isoform X4 [Halyomorpha halys]|uniref:zinc finger protein 219 isoform X4 n=1 Tax=Halyomorpha halys TaxID=286706 RepID=UPI0006D4E8E9|nr:zinc finger Y-chromosomal protein 2-like isoform X4 [Halyomorpha halys]